MQQWYDLSEWPLDTSRPRPSCNCTPLAGEAVAAAQCSIRVKQISFFRRATLRLGTQGKGKVGAFV
jgi:hypothetical protein